jgi:hypothetical protein
MLPVLQNIRKAQRLAGLVQLKYTRGIADALREVGSVMHPARLFLHAD